MTRRGLRARAAGGLATLGFVLAGCATQVSHALLYLGEDRVVEAVGDGVQVRSIDAVLGSEQMVAAFRNSRRRRPKRSAAGRWRRSAPATTPAAWC
jgi:uncharacterized protein YycO